MKSSDTGAAAIILGAGLGRRLGRGPKSFVRIGGLTMLEHAAMMLRDAGLDQIVAVLPPGPDPIALPDGILVARNNHPDAGPLLSAVLGLDRIEEMGRAGPVLLHPVDHLAVGPLEVTRLLEIGRKAGPKAARVVPCWQGRGGHPILVLAPGLAALRAVRQPDASTLRDVLDAAGETIRYEALGPCVLRNINTPNDLEGFRWRHGVTGEMFSAPVAREESAS